jgi:hypothetical protein
MAAFIPGESPPEVKTPIFLIAVDIFNTILFVKLVKEITYYAKKRHIFCHNVIFKRFR